MKINRNRFIELLKKEIDFKFFKIDVAAFSLLLSGLLLIPLVFLLPIVLVGIIGMTFGILSGFRWGVKGGVGFGFWLVLVLIVGKFINSGIFNPYTTPANIGTAFFICIIAGKVGQIFWANQTKLKRTNKWLDTLFTNSTAAIAVIDNKSEILKINNEFKNMFEYAPDEVKGKTIDQVMEMGEKGRTSRKLTASILEGERIQKETVRFDKQGNFIEVLIKGFPIIIEAEIVGGYVIYEDITERKQTKRRVDQLIEKQNLLLDNIEVQIWYLRKPEVYGAVNQAHAQFFGLTKEEVEGKKLKKVLAAAKEVEVCIDGNKRVFKEKEQIQTEEEVTNYKGEKRLLSINKIPKLNQDDKVEYVICSAVDITEQKKAEEKIRYMSFHDELTDLYNRAYIEEKMEQLNNKSHKLPLGLLMVDVNGLKLVNDTFGHEKGDELLIKVAKVLKNSCRKADIIGRFGGDEFVILFPNLGQEKIEKIERRIKQNCGETAVAGIPLSIALGTAVKDSLTQDISEILKEADRNMYENKLIESKKAKNEIINALLSNLEKESAETPAHAIRMQKMGFELGQEIGLSFHELDRLSLVATLHDIGKVVISKQLLTKPAALSEEEWELVEEHTKAGYRITSSTDQFAHVAKEILYHHEFWDGSGYPEGLRGDQIPLLSRIINIIDAYDVMMHGRPYKESVTKVKAKEELKREAGKQFDPQLVESFLELIEADKLGVG